MSLGLALGLILVALMVGACFGALLSGMGSAASREDDLQAALRAVERRQAPTFTARRHADPVVVNRREYARQQHPATR